MENCHFILNELYLLITHFSGPLGKELTAGAELPKEQGQLVPKVNSFRVDLKNV